jgi:transposase
MLKSGAMPQPYSLDLRERAVAAVEAGVSRAQVAQLFSLSMSSLKRWLTKRQASLSLAPKEFRPGFPAQFGSSETLAALRAQLEADPEGRLLDHCWRWHEATGKAVSVSTMHRAWQALGWTHKKSGSRPASATRKNGRRGAKTTPG